MVVEVVVDVVDVDVVMVVVVVVVPSHHQDFGCVLRGSRCRT